jgi:hypothetical protein
MTAFSDGVREVVSPYKFGGSRRAAACYLLSLDSSYDEASGDVDSPTGWFARFDRTLLYCDSLGFVYVEKFPTIEKATEAFASLDNEYAEWDDGEGF